MAEGERHHFKQLKSEILARSQAADWEIAKKRMEADPDL
jgi:hypothetical protein